MNPLSIAVSSAVAASAGVATWAAMHPAAQLFGPTIRRTGDPKTLALTFDDGPNPAVTPALLDVLDKYRVRATFFLIGKHVRACPSLAQEIAACGHTVANHTDTHANLVFLFPHRIREEFERCQNSILDSAGRQASWIRPPYGARGPQLDRVVRKGGWRAVVMWSLLLYDWKPQPAGTVIARLRSARGGDIVLLHDGDPHVLEGDRHHSVQALAHWLPRWVDAGLGFVTLDEIGEQGR